MATVIEKFVAEVGWDIDPKGLAEFSKQAGSVVRMGKALALAFAGATAGGLAFITMTNKQTAEMTQLAAAFGLSGEALERYTDLFQNIGLGSEDVIKSIKTLNDRIGQIKSGSELASVTDAFKSLGVSIKDVQDLEPEKQFETLLAAMKDAEDRQVGLSAATQLFGRAGSRMVGFLQTYDESLVDILDKYSKLDLMTEEGRQGAIRWSRSLNEVKTLFDSMKGLIAGLVGDALTPMIDEFIDWAVVNRELIKTRVREWVDRIVKGLQFMLQVGRGIYRFIAALGGLTNAFKLLAVTVAAVKLYQMARAIQMITVGMRGAAVATALFKTALTGLKTAGIVGLFVLAALALEDLYVALTGGESAFAPLHNAIGKFLAEDVAAFIAGLLGMDPHELNLRVVEFFEETLPNAFDDFINWLVDDILAFIQTVKDFGNSVVWFFEDIYNGITGWVGKAIQWVKTQIAKVPFLGKLLEGGNLNVNAGGGGSVPVPVPVPSIPGALAGGKDAGRSLTVNNAPTINVTQLPGESGETLANRVTQKLNEQAANAVRNNDKGIVR